MAIKIAVKSGDPFRDTSGHFGTSPDAKLKAALDSVRGLSLVPKGSNDSVVGAKMEEAHAKLAAIRGESSVVTEFKNFDVANPYNSLPDSYARTLDDVQKVDSSMTRAKYYHDNKDQAGSLIAMKPMDYLDALVDHTTSREGQWRPSYRSVGEIERRTDMSNVDKYAEAMKRGDIFPIPSLTFGDDGLIDDQEGIHRTLASLKNGEKSIPVYVRYAPTNPPKGFYKQHGDNIITGYDARTDEFKKMSLPNTAKTAEMPKEAVVASVTPQFGMGARPFVANANITPDQQRQIDLATEQFRQSVLRVDNQVLQQYIQAVQDGNYLAAEQILANAQNSQQVNTLMFAMLTIGTILLPLYASQRIQNLLSHFGLPTTFVKTANAQKALKEQAQKGAESHINTIAKDIKKHLDEAIDAELPTVRQGMEDRFPSLKGVEQKDYLDDVRVNADMYKYARQLILAGASRDTIIKKLQENFTDVSKKRANVIAGNESNRVFTLSQFEVDEQFLAQNNLSKKAYKRLVSNTGTPEAVCAFIIAETAAKPIPFQQDFVKFGSELKFKTDEGKSLKFTPDYERLRSGHIHVNCHCRYELLIKQDDGTFFNTYDGKILNGIDWKPELHPRDKDGKFGSGNGILPHIETESSLLEEAKQHKTVDDFKQAVYERRSLGTRIDPIPLKDNWSDPESLKLEAPDLEDGIYDGGNDYLYNIEGGKVTPLKEYRTRWNWQQNDMEFYKRDTAPVDIRNQPIYHNTDTPDLKATDLDIQRSGQNFGGVGGNEFDGIYFTTVATESTFGTNKVEGKISSDAKVVLYPDLLKEYRGAKRDVDMNTYAKQHYDVVDKKDDVGESWEMAVLNPKVIQNPIHDLNAIFQQAHSDKSDNGWVEELHPRDKEGKFGHGDGASEIATLAKGVLTLHDGDNHHDIKLTKLENKMLTDKGIKVITGKDKKYSGVYDPKTKTLEIVNPSSYSPMALSYVVKHELGHVIDYNKNTDTPDVNQMITHDKELTHKLGQDASEINFKRVLNSVQLLGKNKFLHGLPHDKIRDFADGNPITYIDNETKKEHTVQMDKKNNDYIWSAKEVFADGYSQYQADKAGFKKRAPHAYEIYKDLK